MTVCVPQDLLAWLHDLAAGGKGDVVHFQPLPVPTPVEKKLAGSIL